MNTESNIEFTSDFPNNIEEFQKTIKKARNYDNTNSLSTV